MNVLTVRDVLQRPHFTYARVVAGESGLNKHVRWAHVLEVTDFDSLIHGKEMILSTGLGLFKSGLSQADYVQRLINHDVSCLCLELGEYLPCVENETIDIANQCNFPIIVFDKVVRFVDITQDLHSFMINQHHKMLQELDSISQQLHQFTTQPQAITRILRLVHQKTGTNMVYIPYQGKAHFYPALPPQKQTAFNEYFRITYMETESLSTVQSTPWTDTIDGQKILVQKVDIRGCPWAILAMLHKPYEFEELDRFVLDRAALAIAQHLLHIRYTHERKLHAEQSWVNDIIFQRIQNENKAASMIRYALKQLPSVSYRVCVIEIHQKDEYDHIDLFSEVLDSLRFHIALMYRSYFEKKQFKPFISTSKGDELIIIAIDHQCGRPQKERLADIEDLTRKHTFEQAELHIGISQPYTLLTEAHLGYQEAKQTIELRSLPSSKNGVFYEECGVFQLLLNIDRSKVLHQFAHQYLHKLIQYDQNKNTSLMHTLEIYVNNHYSKKETARELHIARQTLYHRLEKIHELLGGDITESFQKRLSVEMALQVYRLLENNSGFME
jgi:PucR family transcriptional regulator, purine catabolism regulatory protein